MLLDAATLVVAEKRNQPRYNFKFPEAELELSAKKLQRKQLKMLMKEKLAMLVSIYES